MSQVKIWQNLTNRRNIDPHTKLKSPTKTGIIRKVFKLKFCKNASVLIHVAYNIRSPVAAQPLFLGLTYLGASKSLSPHTNVVEYFKSPCSYVIKFWLGKHMVFGELGSPNQGGPGKKGLGCLGETWFSTKRTGWVALWRLHWAVEKGTKPQPCCQLE